MKKTLLGGVAVILALTLAAGAQAQTRRAASSGSTSPALSGSTPLNHGPAVVGVCVYSNAQALQEATVGKAFQTRMQQLRAQATAELQGEQTQLQNDEKVLAGKRATLTQAQLAQQAQPLAAREQALQQKAEQRSRDLQYTYVQQLQRIGGTLEPIVRTAYEAHHCSILINGESVMAVNPAMNITPEVVSGLNSRMTTISFERETAPAQ